MNVPNNLHLVSIHDVLTAREAQSDPTLSRSLPNPDLVDPVILEQQRERERLLDAIRLSRHRESKRKIRT